MKSAVKSIVKSAMKSIVESINERWCASVNGKMIFPENWFLTTDFPGCLTRKTSIPRNWFSIKTIVYNWQSGKLSQYQNNNFCLFPLSIWTKKTIKINRITNYTSWQHRKCAFILKLCAQYCFDLLCLKYYFHNLITPLKQLFKMSKQWQPLIQIYSSNILYSCWGRQETGQNIGIFCIVVVFLIANFNCFS